MIYSDKTKIVKPVNPEMGDFYHIERAKKYGEYVDSLSEEERKALLKEKREGLIALGVSQESLDINLEV